MATEWKKPLEWGNAGSEPSETLKTEGFKAGYKPPADLFNYFLHRAYECFLQLQQEADNHADDKENPHGVTAAQIGAAPASHGRHVPNVCATINDWNEAVVNGWYMGNDAENAPTTGWCFGYVISHNENYVFQEVYQFTASTDANYIPKCIRVKMNGTWGEWVDVTVQTKVPVNAILNGAKQDLSNVTDETIQERVNDIFSRKVFGPYCVEFHPPKDATNGGFFDFHYGGDTSKDYTARIIEDVLGELRVVAKLKVDGNIYENGTHRVYSAGNKPTPADIGALPLAGGVMTGQGFYLNNKTGRIVNNNNGFWIRTASGDVDNNADARHIKIWNATYQNDLTKSFVLFDSTTGKDYLLYGEHNPKAGASAQDPNTSLLRNSKLVNAETNPTVNGEICWTYK